MQVIFCIPPVISLRALSVGAVDMLLKFFMSGFEGGITSIAVVCIKIKNSSTQIPNRAIGMNDVWLVVNNRVAHFYQYMF